MTKTARGIQLRGELGVERVSTVRPALADTVIPFERAGTCSDARDRT